MPTEYRTLEALAQGEAKRPELAKPLSEIAVVMPVATNVRTHLIRMGTADSLTLAAFLGRVDLHRRLKSIIPLPALIRAVQEVLAGRVATPPVEPGPKAGPAPVVKIRDLQLKANPTSKIVVTGEVIRVVVDPLETGASLTPGQGAQTSIHLDGAVRRFAHRSFEHELENAQRVVKSLRLPPSRDLSWPTRAHLGVLATLAAERELSVAWLNNAPRFREISDPSGLRIQATERRGWFDLDGGFSFGELQLSLQQLLAAKQPWVEVAPNDFVLLGDELRTTLAALNRVTTQNGVSSALAPVLQALGVEGISRSYHEVTAAPAGLLATLRPYQLEGFQWLARMSSLTQGAVLADDMGLGKTVQALALLLHRAERGRALVVAPSSVISAWSDALAAFAPSLIGTVDLTTWTLLARDPSKFAEQQFATVVLDEAQSLKNADTQRARAAFGLGAQFVLALTGTPIENHLGELWSLFHATVPALLGSETHFREAYLDAEPTSIAALAMVVKPFMLRRTKAAVAPELPPKTERTMLIELSLEERALTELIRREAAASAGSNAFAALAALTRLRLAAGHPALVDATWAGPTSKLSTLRALVATLREEGHRVLVFSQFTKHLALVREALTADGVSWSYLDGSTPTDERAAQVKAFQAGEGGEVFLISLKAGGTGLTLTAADDVIHLDPWWNPAVEDQASDRAHRIGQTRPVTIYRLIAQGTVEEKMLMLHRDKRALVDALLEGSDSASSLSHGELLELLS